MRALTQQNLNGGFAHVIVSIKCFAHFFVQFLHYLPRIFIEQIDETFQYIQMEGGSNQFPMRTPFVSCVWKNIIWYTFFFGGGGSSYSIYLPVLMRRPSPSHGLKKLYSYDLSMYTWLLSTSSTSRGSNSRTNNLGPSHSLHSLS